MVDTQVGDHISVSEVPVVREFVDVFSKEFPGVSPERQVEFRIDLVSGVTSITKASYCLAQVEMQELSSQLQELLGKQFSVGNTETVFQEEGWFKPDVH